ncbi:MAG: glycoside hydrolase family 32 protein [Bacteroidaceae bacterium]|nr:glycoside hydrolase family 32 protein [Bacteroidaceae bacterium]
MVNGQWSMAQAAELSFKVKCQYLNLPISQQEPRCRLHFQAKGVDDLCVVARLSANPEYWVFKDMSAYKGKTLTITFDGAEEALALVYQADTIRDASSIYKEVNRPQFHFTARRGWLNDPNGCIWHDGLYHLYYQHNPFEREWENMTWGHATSPDLLRWTEHAPVLHPDHLGTMYSGSAVFDKDNTSGFGTKSCPPLVYAYTADRSDREVQCIAYSLDGGMTLHKYEGNPVIDSHDKWQTHDTRDPRVFWWTPSNSPLKGEDKSSLPLREGWGGSSHWVLVLNERNGHSIYTSDNLRDWTYQSHVNGFWECPDLFPLPVDGNPDDVRWVMLGASNTYMIGRFDGKTFTPESGKHRFSTGAIYAAQTFTGVPDGRRIQIGWANIDHPGMPFRGQMLLPTELTLRTTKDGIRLVSKPIAEVASLLKPLYSSDKALTEQEANAALKTLSNSPLKGENKNSLPLREGWGGSDGLHLHATLNLSYATSAGLRLNGRNVIDYDLNRNTINGQFYSPQDPTSLSLTMDVYIDRTSVEVFIDDGLYSYATPLPSTSEGKMVNGKWSMVNELSFWGADISVTNLRLDAIKSIYIKDDKK